jgi:hypothetical protein
MVDFHAQTVKLLRARLRQAQRERDEARYAYRAMREAGERMRASGRLIGRIGDDFMSFPTYDWEVFCAALDAAAHERTTNVERRR